MTVSIVALAISFEALTLGGAPLSTTTAEVTHGKVCKDHHMDQRRAKETAAT